jgi:hypothetical protein
VFVSVTIDDEDVCRVIRDASEHEGITEDDVVRRILRVVYDLKLMPKFMDASVSKDFHDDYYSSSPDDLYRSAD